MHSVLRSHLAIISALHVQLNLQIHLQMLFVRQFYASA